MTLVWLVVAWLIGLIAASHAEQPATVWLIIAATGLIGMLVARGTAGWRLLFACAMTFGLGAARTASAQHTISADDLAFYNDRGAADLTGVIVDAPDVRDKTIHLRVQMESIRFGKTTHPIDGVALIEADRFGTYAYGDRLTIFGTPQTPPTFDTFSYQDFLAQSGIHTFILLPKITIVAQRQGSPIAAALFDLKSRAHDLIGRLLPSPQSALLSGIMLGIRTDLPPDVRDAFNVTGATRVLVIDGSKMAVIAGLLYVLFMPVKNKWLSSLLILAGLIGYALFVGASPPVLRAVTMAALTIIAARLGRQSDGLTALAFAVWLQTMLEPNVVGDAGLQISAASTLGLILFADPMTRATENLLSHLFAAHTVKLVMHIVVDTVLVTLVVQIFALPIFFLIFGQFSPIGFLVNMLITPAQAPALILGLIGVIVGAIIFPLGQIITWLAAIPVSYTLALVQSAAATPNASLNVSISPLVSVAYYGVLLGIVYVIRQPVERRTAWLSRLRQSLVRTLATPAIGVVGTGVAVLLWTFALAHPDGRLHVWFLEVGGGNAILIQTPNGAHILIDGGPNPTRLAAAIGERLPFYKRDIDMLIITEPKSTEIAALPPLLARYTPHIILTNGQTVADPAWNALMTTLAQTSARMVTVSAGYQVTIDDGVAIQVLNPAELPDATIKAEDAALVLRLTYHDASFLLTSNLSPDAESAITADGWYLGATVLQMPSHASDPANTDNFLKTIAPQVAVVEAEAGSRTNQPADSALKRLGNTPIYRTDKQGTIEFASDGSHLWISTGR